MVYNISHTVKMENNHEEIKSYAFWSYGFDSRSSSSGMWVFPSSNTDKTYSYIFVNNPDTLDYITSTRDSTSSITTNLIDGLLENDQYGNLIPSMAESWTVSKDGLTYTYKIRQGAKWYTSEGEEYADVTAHDFVTGLKYAADKKAENLYLVQDAKFQVQVSQQEEILWGTCSSSIF